MTTRFDGNVHVAGHFSSETQNIPDGMILDKHVNGSADIAAEKVEHQISVRHHKADGVDIAAIIMPIHTVYGATAEIIAFKVMCIDAPEGGDKKFTVDLKKCNVGSPAPVSILTGVVDYVVDTPDCTVLSGTISSAGLVAGDTLVVVVVVSGTTGNQGQGLHATTIIREKPA